MKDLFEKICQSLTEKFGSESVVDVLEDDEFAISLDENSYIEITTGVDEFQSTAFYMHYKCTVLESQFETVSNPIQTLEEFEYEYAQLKQQIEELLKQQIEEFSRNLSKALSKL